MLAHTTGREPRLSTNTVLAGKRRLSLRRLGTVLNALPPEAISLEAAAELLRSDDFYVRYSTAELLSKRGDREARLLLQALLAGESPPVRASVTRHLYYFSWYVAEPLLRQALGDADHRVRESAVYALCNRQDLDALRLLAEALSGETDEVLMAAAWGLVGCRDTAAVPALELALQAADPQVRVKALEALGSNGTLQAAATVRRTLQQDPDLDVIYAATLSLVELAGESCLPEVAAAIAASHGPARRQLLRGLFHATNYRHLDVAQATGLAQLLDALARALADEAPETRLAAVYPLAWMGGERAAALVRAAYEQESDPALKEQIAHVAASFQQM
ncbi:MAG: HEAT repeat domain-containing protein [Chloroflexi bacterium]|nr:HEAT repeat domain-containing protein [Chloroflexota bacterium]MCI0579803.1 HEAT repeat domain-containing protein [Chloroflexota bacterium]MCI0644577.1 HEAT repeat domain-containing protein [Chloroflexota bacterium]MCI0731076.1 HEAT repeat domain-containing protein [Chloroflexota bacterium]